MRTDREHITIKENPDKNNNIEGDVTVKTLRDGSWKRKFVALTLILAAAFIVNAGMGLIDSADAAFTITSCTDCHGQPPAESATRNTPAGAVVGSHVKHVTDEGIACTLCHGDTTSGGTNYAHRNGNIEFASPIHSGTGAYSKGTSFAQSNDLDGSGLGTCSSIYCHSNVQATNGTAAADTFATPTWGSGALACDACHGQDADETDGMPASGSHDEHAGSQAGEHNYACATCHNNGGDGSANHANDTLNMDIDNTYGASAAYSQGDHTPGSGGYGNCSTTYCHGSASPAWGTDLSTYDTCTKCHGENAASPTEAQKAPGGSGSDTNGDTAATDAQVGAHQAHMGLPSGYTDVLNSTGNCNECHVVPSAVSDAGHIDSALPAEIFTGNSPEKADLNSVTPAYATGVCTVYCHGASMPGGSTGGSDTSPTWNQTTLLTGTPSLAGDCGVCHGAPPSIDPHSGSETINDCDTCHTHLNNDGTFLDASLHINGVINASGACNTCHAYPPTPGDGKTYKAVEGKGAHAAHVTHIATLLSVTLDASTDAFLNNTVCGVCHDVTVAGNHQNGARNISISASYQFGASAPAYNGVVGTVGATTAKTCSNISCHFTTTPEWESY